MHATQKECYWAEYIRDEQSLWIGADTESLILKKFVINKLNILKTPWTVISNIPDFIKFSQSSNIKKYYFLTPEAQDIIPFVLLKIKAKKYIFNTKDNNINYFYNCF